MKINHHIDFLLASLIVFITVFLSIAAYNRYIVLSFFVGPLRFSHWLSIIGTIYIAVSIPIFVFWMRSNKANRARLFRFHIFGNLLSFMLISIHFAAQVGRSPANYPELGTGVAMFIAMALEVATGFTQRFRSQRPFFTKWFNFKTNMFIHASLVMVFYAVILFHVLHAFSII